MVRGEQGAFLMTQHSSMSFFQDGNQHPAETFFETFFDNQTCDLFGWGPLQAYPAHTVVIRQENPGDAVYFMKKGMVKLTWMDNKGHEVIAGLRCHPWIIGAPSVLLERPYAFTVTTLSECFMRCIAARNFLHLVKTKAEFSVQLIRLLCEEILTHAKKLGVLGCVSARERLRGLLSRLVPDICRLPVLKEQVRIQLPLKHKEIAQIIAVTPEHLSRLLREFEQDGLIKREKDVLILLNPARFLP